MALASTDAPAVSHPLLQHGIRPERWERRYGHVFDGVDLRGRSVLDIGGGIGLGSLYAAKAGAKRIVCLEPEAAGASSKMVQTATELRSDMGFDHVIEVVPQTLAEANVREPFDVVLVHNSINHFDDIACSRMHEDADAWAAYRTHATMIARSCKPGGILIVADCARFNLLARLGIPNPLTRTINWKIHQPPELWAELFEGAGFSLTDIRWSPLPSLGPLGRVCSWKPVAMVSLSHFCLRMRYAPH